MFSLSAWLETVLWWSQHQRLLIILYERGQILNELHEKITVGKRRSR